MNKSDLEGLPIPRGYDIVPQQDTDFQYRRWIFITPSNLDSVDLYGAPKGIYSSEEEAIGGAFDHYMTSGLSGG